MCRLVQSGARHTIEGVVAVSTLIKKSDGDARKGVLRMQAARGLSLEELFKQAAEKQPRRLKPCEMKRKIERFRAGFAPPHFVCLHARAFIL